MSILLAEAIAQLQLKPGQWYRTTVNGQVVDIHMHQASAGTLATDEPSQFADLPMIEPWFDAPAPRHAFTVRTRAGGIDLPDAPQLPSSDEVDA